MNEEMGVKEARWWDSNEGVECRLCPHHCSIGEGKLGICRTRGTQEGRLMAFNYGRVCSIAQDPVEKKPVFHYRPGSRLLSLGSFGCNMRCRNCQNAVLATAGPGEVPEEAWSPEQVVEHALEKGVDGLGWTYNEPITWAEFVLDTSRMARGNGLYTLMNTNGYVEHEPIDEMVRTIDAMNVDVKGFTDGFYRENCGASLDRVLDTCEHAHRSGVHLELTYLLIPGLNDGVETMREFFRWVVGTLGEDVPVHLFRFLPFHLLSHLPEQSMAKMEEAYGIAREAGIRFPYLAGVIGDEHQSTYCPDCGTLLIARSSEEAAEKVMAGKEEVSRFCPTYAQVDVRIDRRSCPACGANIPVVL
ncbi:MAG: AmmeMemoRadiSam system radical SAM enzyme [Methanomassiliicoccales archaeon]